LQNSCKFTYFCIGAFLGFCGDLLGLLHGCCTDTRISEAREVCISRLSHHPQTRRNASVSGTSNSTQRRTADAEFAVEVPSAHADGGGLQGDDRSSDLTRNIRWQILEELRHDRQIEDALLRTTGSLCCVSHAQGLVLFHCHSLCLADFSICLTGAEPLLWTAGLLTLASPRSRLG
jgi:hypothetical protein